MINVSAFGKVVRNRVELGGSSGLLDVFELVAEVGGVYNGGAGEKQKDAQVISVMSSNKS